MQLQRNKASIRKGGRAGAAACVQRYRIDDDDVTLGDIAARISRSSRVAAGRLRREQAKPGPVTWAGLESTT